MYSISRTLPQLLLLYSLRIYLHRLGYTYIASITSSPPLPLTTYPLQQHTCRLIIRVLRYKSSSKGFAQNTLSQALCTFQISPDNILKLLDNRQATLNFCHDDLLLN